ncbi:MAG: glycoside hydrolase family 2 TIM barrel-domain containing protein, partial [Phycisphaeraceae bacterium JB051]
MIRFKSPLMMSWLVCLTLCTLISQAIAQDTLRIGFEEEDKVRLTEMGISAWKADQRDGDKARIMLKNKASDDAHALIDVEAYTPGKQYDHLTLRAFAHGDFHPKQVGRVEVTVSEDGVTYSPVKLSAKRKSKLHGGWYRYVLTTNDKLKPFRYVKLRILDIPVYWRLELADLWLANGKEPVIADQKDDATSDKQSKASSLLPAGQSSDIPVPQYDLLVEKTSPSSNTVHDLLICPLNPDDETLHTDALSRYPWVATKIDDTDFRSPTWKSHPNLKIADETQTVLYRFAVDITQWPGHGQLMLELDQCAFVTTVYVNSKKGSTIREGLLPIAFDLTPLITPGDKKLDVVLYVQDYRKQIDQARNYPTMPLGAMFKWTKGISSPPRITWQTSLHSEKPFVYSDVLNNQLTTQTTVTNNTAKAQQGTLVRKIISDEGVEIFTHQQTFTIPANQAKQLSHTFTVNGELKRWDIGKPNLYFAVDAIHVGGKVIDQRRTRFGYRTVTINGEDLLLNGRKIQLVGPWSHIGQWCWPAVKGYDIAEAYRLMLKHGMNYGRLHGQPYPKYFYDTADEVGFLLVAESGLFHRPIADISLDHIRNMALTLRNHPSVVAWSGSNEFEHWITPRPEPAMDFLIKVYDTYKSVDPTRPVYHSGFGDARNHFDAYNIHYPELMRTYPQGVLWKEYAPDRIKLLHRHTFASYNPIGKKPIFVGEHMTPGRGRGMEALLGEAHLKLQYQDNKQAYRDLLANQGKVWGDMVRVYRDQNIAMLSPNMMHIPIGVESPFLIEIGKELRGVSSYIQERDPILITGSTQQRTLILRDTDGYLDAGKVRITITANKQLLYAHAM